jgi:simple sugar transport system permease protein
MSRRRRSIAVARGLSGVLTPVVILLLGLLAGSVVVIVSGESPLDAYVQLIVGAFGDLDNITSTLLRATPIIITGVGVSISLRAGIFNLGGVGQMLMGGITAAAVGITLSAPRVFSLPALLLLSALVGAITAVIPAYLEARYRVSVIVVTLLMNYIINLLVEFFVNYPLHDSTVVGLAAETVPLNATARLGRLIPGTRLHTGLLIAVVLVVLVKLFFDHTTIGYELRMTGLNPLFAEYSGLDRMSGIMVSMCLAGALAGIAGAIEVAGVHERFVAGVLNEYAWTGLTAALLGSSRPVPVAIAGLLLAALHTGALGVQRFTNVPVEMADIVQASIMFFVAARLGIRLWLERLERSKVHAE